MCPVEPNGLSFLETHEAEETKVVLQNDETLEAKFYDQSGDGGFMFEGETTTFAEDQTTSELIEIITEDVFEGSTSIELSSEKEHSTTTLKYSLFDSDDEDSNYSGSGDLQIVTSTFAEN